MSMRYPNGAIIKPGFNPVLIPGAPTIGTVTPGIGQIIVAFTAPTDIGGSAITSYQVVSSPGSIIATGASSPITVTGLTGGTSYTFRVAAINSYGAGTFSAASASATPIIAGQQAYMSAGTYTWIAPAGVTSVSAVAVGGGASGGRGNYNGGSGGTGGNLRYTNNITVTPGASYTVIVGSGGQPNCSCQSNAGGTSSFSSGVLSARGGNSGGLNIGTGGNGGSGGGNGGFCGCLSDATAGAGGGAGGYSGNGGNGGDKSNSSTAGSGGGGGGGSRFVNNGAGGGGGVGLLGQGSNGTSGGFSGGIGGGGGSGGTDGANSGAVGGNGGQSGGGGGGGRGSMSGGVNYFAGSGSCGAVRIIWPGTTRSFPSTCTGNL